MAEWLLFGALQGDLGEMHLDRDRGGLKSKQGAALHQRKAHG